MPEHLDKSTAEDPQYFSLQASWGITTHIGGLRSTSKLAIQCRVKPDDSILLIGCGNGQTSVYLVKKYGCSVTGIDISEEMVALSSQRAAKQKLADRAVFQVADAQHLPFGDGKFDAVICESVNAFVPDKLAAMREYRRVLKPGRSAGINEISWLKPPTPRITDYLSRSMGARPLEYPGWQELMQEAGFKNVTGQLLHPNMLTIWYDEFRMMGITQALKSWGSFLKMTVHGSPQLKHYFRDLWPPPWNILSYMGYGLYYGEA